MKKHIFLRIFTFLTLAVFGACSGFNYKTYDTKQNEGIDDPEPNYELTLDPGFQDFTTFMFIGNRIENFSTYFNTFFNAAENFDDAYNDYATRVLANYNERQDSIFARPRLSQESIDKFNIAIEKASKVIQYHKSSVFMDRSVLLVGKSYYFLGDYLKAERKFGEFISRLKSSRLIDEALLYLAKTQLRLENEAPALERLNILIKTSESKSVISECYQSLAEYYLNKKDYTNAIKNFKKAIELSGDNEFKAQMQFLVASVISKNDPLKSAREYDKVLDYNASYDLEYLARFNTAKNLVASRKFNRALPIIEDLEVKYKDNTKSLEQINYLLGVYYEEKNEYKNAVKQYYYVIKKYPSTVSSAEASFRIAKYFETEKDDYLNAYRYFRFSTEQSTAGQNYLAANTKKDIYKRYFELRSVIADEIINTGYDEEFKKNTIEKREEENPLQPPKGEDFGKPGGFNGGELNKELNKELYTGLYDDSLETTDTTEVSYVDSTLIKEQLAADAKFELAELFLYNLNRTDSSEFYLLEALNQSYDNEFYAKVLFALSALYRKENNYERSDEILRQIVNEYPLSKVANSSRRLLNLSIVDVIKGDDSDSLYNLAESYFISNEYYRSLAEFRTLIDRYPLSIHKDKALFATGWIYENALFNGDSAYYYYSSLVKEIPNSETAAMVMLKVEEYENFNKTLQDTSGVINDSVKIEIDPLQNQEDLKKSDNSIKSGETNENNTNEEGKLKKNLPLDKINKDGEEKIRENNEGQDSNEGSPG